ncbi:hypothetical protein AHF37_03808 [Paragonimus kellicotti]|nr:hypothetical protein AHF37_03808 [Paragonimus kellicotti]
MRLFGGLLPVLTKRPLYPESFVAAVGGSKILRGDVIVTDRKCLIAPLARLPCVHSDMSTASDEHCVSSGEATVNTDRSRQTYSLLGLEWSVWRDVEQGGGAGSPKRKSKPTDTNEHRGLLLPFSLSSPTGFLIALQEANADEKVQQDEWVTADQTRPHKPVSTFGKLFGLSVTRAANVSTIGQTASSDRSTVINEECGHSHVLQLSDSAGVVLILEEDHIRVDLLGGSRGFLEHLRRSWNRLQSPGYLREEGVTADPNVTTILCSTVELYPAITENEFYWIDNDHFEACPIRVRVRRNAVNVYQQQD